MLFPAKLTFAVLIVVAWLHCPGWTNELALADPNLISSGFQFNRSLQLRVGQLLSYQPFALGGLVEIRNEERYNQGIFPNHSWRGVFLIRYGKLWYPGVALKNGWQADLGGDFFYEHESSHATMGIQKPSQDPADMIYDGQWRNVNLNSLNIRPQLQLTRSRLAIHMEGRYQAFLFSRNQPEFMKKNLGHSQGMAVGITPVLTGMPGGGKAYASGFFKSIFTGKEKAHGEIYQKHGESPSLQPVHLDYPLIKGIESWHLRLGYIIRDKRDLRDFDFYGHLSWGHPGGFVDSRETRRMAGIGLDIR